jgi:hypothetical protein
VTISQTKDFSDDNRFAGISGASVTIENNGLVTSLEDKGNGVYQAGNITGVPGQTYHLAVRMGNAVYTATSIMPQPVALDSLYISKGMMSDDNYVTVVYQDPAGTPNYYRFVQYVNGKKEKSIFVSSDEFTDGHKVKDHLFYMFDKDDSTRKIKSGDLVKVDMMTIDPAVYKYWFSMSQGATGENQSASPANPVTNIKGGALGYFSAQTWQSKSVQVP